MCAVDRCCVVGVRIVHILQVTGGVGTSQYYNGSSALKGTQEWGRVGSWRIGGPGHEWATGQSFLLRTRGRREEQRSDVLASWDSMGEGAPAMVLD